MEDRKTNIAIVIPVYGGADILPELTERLQQSVATITQDFEILFINDASPDHAAIVIAQLMQRYTNIRSIEHEKNKGQHVSILAGLKTCNAAWVVIMDCDLQDLPEEIPHLFAETSTTQKIILAARKGKQFSPAKKIFSVLLNTVLLFLTAKSFSSATGNFGIYHKSVVEKIKLIPASRFYFPAAIRNAGYPVVIKTVEHGQRKSGGSSYHLFSLLKLSCTAIRASVYKVRTTSV